MSDTLLSYKPLSRLLAPVLRSAGALMLRDMADKKALRIKEKSPVDFVTKMDKHVEQMLIDHIKKYYKGHRIIAEEAGNIYLEPSAYTWIIDPIDGTTNFIYGFPFFCISVALMHDNELLYSAIYHPITDELFTAYRNQGSHLNERKRLRVTQIGTLQGSVLATGKLSMNHAIYNNMIRHTAGIRQTGSAALNLAYLASGRIDGFWEDDLQSWDIAAGILIAREAGALVSDFNDQQNMLDRGQVVAANRALQPKLIACIDEGNRSSF